MKKFINTFTSLLLAAAMLLPSLSSCTGGDAPTEDEEEETTVSLSGYTVLRSDLSSDVVTQAAVTMRAAIEAALGEKINISTDYSKDGGDIPADAREILLGDTNRTASSAASEGLGEYDYSITRSGSFIVIAGGSDGAVAEAAARFTELYIDAENQTAAVPQEINIMHKFEKTDNSALIPAYVSDEKVTLEPCEPDGKAMTPDWAKSLILTEVHLETATEKGTFEAAVEVLDHCAEMGVNGIWLTPIYEKGVGGNGYGNIGPHTVEPALTGTDDYAEGWQVVKRFVDEAHSRGIRVLLDIITWGTVTAAPLYSEHPDWYSGEAWGNKAFDWTNSEFVDWFVQTAIDNILASGADGYRCDCEPNYTGYKVFDRIREGCLEAGRKILVIAEDGCMRKDCFDFEQDGVLWYSSCSRGEQYQNPKAFYIDELNIVESVKNGVGIGSSTLQGSRRGGQFRFYTYCVSNHDYQYSITNGNRLVIGYQAIFAPFIPLWYLGAEFNMQAEQQVIYFVQVDWSKLDDYSNAMFYEDVKRYIKIRRTYPELFEYWPDDHRDSNICEVSATGTALTAYARYYGGKAALIVPNNSGSALSTTVTVPFEAAGIAGFSSYTVTDLLSGEIIASGGADTTGSFTVNIENEHIGVYLVEGN